jgi:hypothetical protein
MTTSRSPREVTAGERAADQAAPRIRHSRRRGSGPPCPERARGNGSNCSPNPGKASATCVERASSHRPIPATSLNLLDSIPLPDRGMFHASPAAAAALSPATRE